MKTTRDRGDASGGAAGSSAGQAPGVLSLRARVIGLVTVALMPAVVGAVWYVARDEDRAIETAYEKAGVLVDSTATSLSWALDDSRLLLQAVAERHGNAGSFDCDGLQAWTDAPPVAVSAPRLWRLDGTPTCPAGAAAGAGTRSAWFAPALASGGFHVSSPWQEAPSNRWMVKLSLPVRDDQGRTTGLVAMAVDLEALNARLLQRLPANAIVAVVDAQHRIVLRSTGFEDRVGRQVPERFQDAVSGMADARLVETGVDGVRRLYVTRALEGTGWRIWAALPEAEVLAPWRADRNRTLSVIAGALAALVVLSWLMLRGTLRPVHALAEAARRVTAGSTTARAPVSGPAEIRDVAMEFNRMLDARDAAAAALRASELRFRTLIDQLPVGVVEHAADTAITLFNAEACRLLGLTPEQMSGRQAPDPAWRFVDEHGVAMPLQDYPVMRVLSSGQPLHGLIVGILAHVESEPTWVHVNAFPEHDGHGVLQRVIVVFIDITARRQAEALREARDLAELSNRAKTAFLSRVSHELRTPLNAVLGFSQLLQIDPLISESATASSQVEMVRNAGEHLLALVDDLLDLARIEAGEMQMSLEAISLASVAQDCAAMVNPMADAARVHLKVDAPPDGGPRVSAEPARLRQILVNLLTNAIKYNRPGGSIDVGFVAEEHRAGAFVRDTGVGMTALQQAALFQPFNRLGADSRGIEGTGLGLVIARQLIELMGGTLEVRSHTGEGSTFTAWLPRATESSSAAPAPGTALQPAVTEDGRALVCVCVEDNRANAQLVRQALALRPQVQLHLAADGVTGLQTIRELRPPLVLLDLDLPGMNGYEILQALREDGFARPAFTVVALTAWSTTEDVARAREAGFDVVITKPFDLQRLLAVVDAATASLATAG